MHGVDYSRVVVFWLGQSEEVDMERRIGRSRIGIVLVIVGSVFLLTAGAAFAASSAGSALVIEGVSPAGSAGSGGLASTGAISGTQPVTGGNMIAGCIAALFQVPISDVVDLHSQGYGFGELAIAYALAEESGLTLEDILDLYQADMGWGEIAKYLGLLPSNRDRNLGRIVSGRVTVSGTVSTGAQRLAERLDADPEEVAALLDQGASYGAVVAAYKLAGQYEGVTPQELIEQRLAGVSWGQIKRDLQPPVTTTSQSGPVEQAGPPDDEGPADHTGRPDHAGKPDHAGPKDHDKGPK